MNFVVYNLHVLLHTGDIGGSMGLFIGGSVLSLAEFVDIFIYRWMLKSCRDKKIK